MYMPQLISAGKVYRAVPPLFGVKDRSGNKYFTTKLDFTKYIQSLFAKTHTLTDMNGRKLSNSEVTALFFKNIDYKEKIEVAANTFAVDPDLLENIFYYLCNYINIGTSEVVTAMAAKVKLAKKKVAATKSTKKTTSTKETKIVDDIKPAESDDEDNISDEAIPISQNSVATNISYSFKSTFSIKKFSTYLTKLYRFIKVYENNGVICIEGLVNSKYQYVFINSKLINVCTDIIDLIKNNTDLYYLVDGEKLSIYNLMSKFNEMMPPGLTRYKGLGEMNERQLWETTMDPARRSLIQINIGEEGDVENKINILMGDDPEPRREWIENNVVFDSDDNFILEGDDEDE